VHDLHSRHFASDVAQLCGIAGERLAYLVLPKANSVDEVRAALAQIAQHARADLPLQVLIETHGALHDAYAIAALPQVECLSFGIMDFVSSHHGAIPAQAMRSPGQFSHPLVVRAKLEVAAACHAHGKIASHNVTTEFKDSAVAANDAARAAAEFGYQRMWSIHPNQIKPIIKAFAPRNSEVSEALAIIASAQEADWAPISFDGTLHDRASYRYFWQVLMRAHATGRSLPAPAAEWFATGAST